MERINENHSIKLLQGLSKSSYTMDSANLDIWEAFQDIAIEEGGDDTIAEFDTPMFTLNMSVRVTLKDIEYWDNHEDITDLYIKKRDEVLRELKF